MLSLLGWDVVQASRDVFSLHERLSHGYYQVSQAVCLKPLNQGGDLRLYQTETSAKSLINIGAVTDQQLSLQRQKHFDSSALHALVYVGDNFDGTCLEFSRS